MERANIYAWSSRKSSKLLHNNNHRQISAIYYRIAYDDNNNDNDCTDINSDDEYTETTSGDFTICLSLFYGILSLRNKVNDERLLFSQFISA